MDNKQKATWIWYPGDFEIWLHHRVSLQRAARKMIIPPIWRLDHHYSSVVFQKVYQLDAPEIIRITVDGFFTVAIDGLELYGDSTCTQTTHEVTLPAGSHKLTIAVINDGAIPALYVQGSSIYSDTSWMVSCHNKRWETIGYADFDQPDLPPSQYKLATTPIDPVSVQEIQVPQPGLLLDFGKETFGYVQIQVQGKGRITVVYGESVEEALSLEYCEVIDEIAVDSAEPQLYTTASRAFRYLYVVPENCTCGKVNALYEYLPLEYRGTFRSSNEGLNAIWDTALYTLHLNTREFFLDGIKRDRWVWSGDAYQSALMNYYSFFDQAVTRRTWIALRGKDPVEMHINTILDYSFYWFIGLYDYYLYTGDLTFVRQNYRKMLSLLDFCLGRRNTNGLVEGFNGDWVFVDWAPIDNHGEVSTIQLLFVRSLETMALFAQLLEDKQRATEFERLAREGKEQLLPLFWDKVQGAFIHTRIDGVPSQHVTKYPNMLALLFGYLTPEYVEQVKHNVLLNDKVQKITTPYMRFYELAALCEIGEQKAVLQEILSYWGGMLDLGATSFWETFDPAENGSQHTAMYGRPFGRSFCHAWGASPIYLLGKYYLGVQPLTPGYESYLIAPRLGGLDWIEGQVPLPHGEISVYADRSSIKVHTPGGSGFLRFQSLSEPVVSAGNLRKTGENSYELVIDTSNLEYQIAYTSLD